MENIQTETSEQLATSFTNADSKLEERKDLARYVTPFEAKQKPIYDWFVYPHSFSPALVTDLVKRFALTEQDKIFDPFVGAGTTLLAAKETNISAVGLDILPVSAALTQAKIANYDLETLEKNIKTVKRLLRGEPSQETRRLAARDPLHQMLKADKSIIARAFDDDVFKAITLIKAVISRAASNSDNYNFLRVALLALLERYSNTMKAGGWLKIIERDTGSQLATLTLTSAFLSYIQKMQAEIKVFQEVERHGTWSVKLGDARQHHSELGQFKAIITSPPYLNRHDYTRVLSLELLVGCLQNYDEIKDLRHDLLRSHVEAKTKFQPIGYKAPDKLTEVLEELKERKAENRVLYIVSGYFEDMYGVLKAAKQSLTKNGYIAFVLGNVRFSGLAIPVDEIIAEIGESVGLKWQTSLIARRRNNSAQQMRDFGRDPARESIIIWQNF